MRKQLSHHFMQPRRGRLEVCARSGRSSTARGGVLVEFAISLPFLILIMSGLFQISTLISMYGPSGNVAFLTAMTGAQIPNSVGGDAMVARGSELMQHLNTRGLLKGESVTVQASYGPENTSVATVSGAAIQLWPGMSVQMSTTFTVPVLAKSALTDIDEGFGIVTEAVSPCEGKAASCETKTQLVEETDVVLEFSKEAPTLGVEEFSSSLKMTNVTATDEGYWAWYKNYMTSYDSAAGWFAPYIGKLSEENYAMLLEYCQSSEDHCYKALFAVGWDSGKPADWTSTK